MPRSTKFACLITVSIPILLSAPQVSAQTATPEQAQMSVGASDARVQMVAKDFGLSRAEATQQLALEDQFQNEVSQVAEQFGDAFLASEIGRGPRFSLTLYFDRDVSLPNVQQALSAQLRPYVRIQRSRLTKAGIDEGRTALVNQLKDKVDALSVGFNFARDRFNVYLAPGDRPDALMPQVSPDLRPYVDFMQGASRALISYEYADSTTTEAREPYATETNAIWGGWPLYFNNRYGPGCTGGFVAFDTLSNDYVLLTAGHCDNAKVEIRWPTATEQTFTWKPMTDAMGERYGGNYDFQTHWGAYLSSSGYVWTDNNVSGTYRYDCAPNGTGCKTGTFRNFYSGLSQAGWSAVTGAVKGTNSTSGQNTSHPLNSTRCKYGMRTGITCGYVSDTQVDAYDSEKGVTIRNLVRLRMYSEFQAAVAKGDSGGPVFIVTSGSTTPTQVSAAGLTSFATVRSTGVLNQWRPCVASLDGACYVDFMPIDRINDTYPYAIRTSSGTNIDVQ